MTAAEIREVLAKRWPPAEYAAIFEAPQGADCQGRKLDAVFVSLWRSRGHELDGVEIKVSVRDWRRELREAAKADWWWRHVHRFWVAVPVAIAPKVRDELPSGWGLLACDQQSSSVVVAAQRHDPEPLDWPACVGLIRTAGGAGLNALTRARAAGYDEGLERGKALAQSRDPDSLLRTQHVDLVAKVRAFEEASGVSIGEAWNERTAGRLGQLVTLLQDHSRDPAGLAQSIRSTASRLEGIADGIAGLNLEPSLQEVPT